MFCLVHNFAVKTFSLVLQVVKISNQKIHVFYVVHLID